MVQLIGETLPQHLYNQVCEARKFMSGTSLLRQIYFTMMDLQLHQLDMTKTTLDIPKFQRKMADKYVNNLYRLVFEVLNCLIGFHFYSQYQKTGCSARLATFLLVDMLQDTTGNF